jgi:hypothetical protein
MQSDAFGRDRNRGTERGTILAIVIGDGPASRTETCMSSAPVNAVVRLKEDIPGLCLGCGADGIVVKAWVAPAGFFYEVEFTRSVTFPAVRALLRAEQLEVVE